MCGQREHSQREAMHSLSPNQLRVVVALAKGERYRDIAKAMGISVSTVNSHRRIALEKLDLCTNNDLVKYCWRAGLTK